MTAKPKPIPTIAFTSPTTGKKINCVYEICQRTSSGQTTCPNGPRAPCGNDVFNPSNQHTHGLLTPARAATRGNPTWGDDIFVQVFNPANGTPNPVFNPHETMSRLKFVMMRRPRCPARQNLLFA